MEKIIIYGAGNTGKVAYQYLENKYDCLFFVDKDEKKWNTNFCGKMVYSPEKLRDLKCIKLIVASVFYKEILREIEQYKIENILVFQLQMETCLSTDTIRQLNKRTIDLGGFLDNDRMKIKELTFIPGGSGFLDYVFLKKIAMMFNCKTYLEIGTYIGESINILTDCCDKLYSVTAPLGASFSTKTWCQQHNIPDYSGRLTYSEKIEHFFTDSKNFDFLSLKEKIDLYFIDGDHSYEGVFIDTKNIFGSRKEESIVVWHDFKIQRNEYNVDVVRAVKDALQEEFKNVYVTNNNLCGVYIPEKYTNMIPIREMRYEENAPLYTYDILIEKCEKF